MPGDTILEMKNITKDFPGVRALDDINFELRKGEIHALVGENGAGKSTLMSVLAGVHTDFVGTIVMDGKPVRLSNPKDAAPKRPHVRCFDSCQDQRLPVADRS